MDILTHMTFSVWNA